MPFGVDFWGSGRLLNASCIFQDISTQRSSREKGKRVGPLGEPARGRWIHPLMEMDGKWGVQLKEKLVRTPKGKKRGTLCRREKKG